MRRSAFYALVLFFVLLYTQGVWRRLGVPKPAVDAALLALPLVVLLSKREALGKPAPGFLLLWFYVGWSLCACIYNGEGIVRGLLYPRFLIGAYIVFWAVWDSRFTLKQLFWINATIFSMFFLQVAAALLEWLVLGERVEANVGTMGSQGGEIATTFPMFAFSCMLAFFLYYNRPVFLAAGFSFVLVSYASGKLGIYYFLPVMLVLGLMLYAAAEGLQSAIKRSLVAALLAVGVLPFLLLLLSHTDRAEMVQDEIGVRNKVGSFLSYTRDTNLESKTWYTTSRVGTSKRVIEETFRREPSVFLFGQGTSVLLDISGLAEEGAYDEYGIIYGMVGWSTDALAVGWPAMFAHIGFYSYLFYLLLRSRPTLGLDVYWKAILLTVQLGFFVFFITYTLYAIHFTTGGWLSSVHLYFLALLLAPQYREVLHIPLMGPRRAEAKYPQISSRPHSPQYVRATGTY